MSARTLNPVEWMAAFKLAHSAAIMIHYRHREWDMPKLVAEARRQDWSEVSRALMRQATPEARKAFGAAVRRTLATSLSYYREVAS